MYLYLWSLCRDFYHRLSLIITTITIFLNTTTPLIRITIPTNPHAHTHYIRDKDKDKDRSISSIAYLGAVTCISSRYLVTRTSFWCTMLFFRYPYDALAFLMVRLIFF